MSTPYPEMHKVFWDEFDKCEYWYRKKSKEQSFKDSVVKAFKGMEQYPKLPSIEYNAKSGNNWQIYSYIIRQRNSSIFATQYNCVCYWNTFGSFGAFLPMVYEGEKTLLILGGHFWQRLCERMGCEMKGVQTAIDFFLSHSVSSLDLLPPKNKDTRKQAIITFHGGAGYGVEVDSNHRIFEIRTFLNEKELQGWRKTHYNDIISNLAQEEDKIAWTEIQCVFESHPECNTILDGIEYMSSRAKDFIAKLIERIERDYNTEEYKQELLDDLFKMKLK